MPEDVAVDVVTPRLLVSMDRLVLRCRRQGIQVIQELYPEATLVGLDKGVFIGPCEDPVRNPFFSTAQLKQLADLGFEYNREQESWEFYTGHG